MNKLRKGDEVVVITGRDKGRRGTIIRVVDAGHVLVENVNMVKRHTKPNPARNTQGGIVEKEAPIHISNVMLVDPDQNVRTRIGRRRDAEGAPERFAKKSGAALA